MKIKNNKSQTHIEMILSFVIFLGFLLAIFIFINPVRQNPVSYASVDLAQEKIINNISIYYNTVSVTLKTIIPSTNCFLIANKQGLSTSDNILARDFKNIITPVKIDSSGVSIKSTGETFYKLYSSASFNQSASSPSGCATLSDVNYTFGILDNGKDVLYENILDLQTLYMNDYDALKNGLAIPGDFEFAVYHFNHSVILNETLAKHKLRSGNVLSREIPLKALKKDASKIDILLNIKVW